MRLARFTLSPLLTSGLLAFPAPAFALAPTQGIVSIEAPATVAVIQNVVSQANIVVNVVATPAPTVSPGTASVATSANETLQFTTSATDMTPASSFVLSQDAVSVAIGPIPTAQAEVRSSASDSVIVVLAQYN